MKKFYENKFMAVHYDETLNLVIEQWKDYQNLKLTKESYQEGAQGLLTAIEANKATKWLAVLTELKVLSIENQHWFAEHIFPKAIKAGITQIAVLNAKDIFGLVATKNILRKMGTGITLENFDSYDKAIQWLRL